MNKLLILGMTLLAQAQSMRIIGILFGDDVDDWGCKPSAGYVWCNETRECIPMNEICPPSFFGLILDNDTFQI